MNDDLVMTGPAQESWEIEEPPGCDTCAPETRVIFKNSKVTFTTCIVKEQLGQDLTLNGETINLMCLAQRPWERENGLCTTCGQVVDQYKSDYLCKVTFLNTDGTEQYELTIQANKEFSRLPDNIYPVSINCSTP